MRGHNTGNHRSQQNYWQQLVWFHKSFKVCILIFLKVGFQHKMAKKCPPGHSLNGIKSQIVLTAIFILTLCVL